jgi:hypothetical protein
VFLLSFCLLWVIFKRYLDELAKSRKTLFFVIPAEAGIQHGRRPSAGLNAER